MAKKRMNLRERMEHMERQLAAVDPFAAHDVEAWEACKKHDSASPMKNIPAMADRWARLVQSRIGDGSVVEEMVDECLRVVAYGKLPDERIREQLYRLLQAHWGHDEGFRALLKWRYSLNPVFG